MTILLHSTSLSQSPDRNIRRVSPSVTKENAGNWNRLDMRDSRDSKNTTSSFADSRSTTRSVNSKRTGTSTKTPSPARRTEELEVSYCELDNCMDSLEELLDKSCETEGLPVASPSTSSVPALLELPSLDNGSNAQSDTRSMSNCGSRRTTEDHSTGVGRKVRFEIESQEGYNTSRTKERLQLEAHSFPSSRRTTEENVSLNPELSQPGKSQRDVEPTRDDQSTESSFIRSLEMSQVSNDRAQRPIGEKDRPTTDLLPSPTARVVQLERHKMTKLQSRRRVVKPVLALWVRQVSTGTT
jgi:hypothetical protein